MAVPLICFRVPLELKLQVETHCESLGIGLSEWYRALTIQALGLALGVDDGYRQGRSLALDTARALLTQAFDSWPATAEEALARMNFYRVNEPRYEGTNPAEHVFDDDPRND